MLIKLQLTLTAEVIPD